jgi:integrase
MARSNIKLTKRYIDSCTFKGATPKSQDIRWDAELSGFGLRIYESGRKTFVLSYRSEGRKHIMQLGPFGVLSLDEARDKARRSLVEVLDGKNPIEKRKAEAQGETVGDLCKVFITQHAEAKLRPRTIGEYRRQIETHVLPIWKTRKVVSIKRADIAALHSKIGERAPTQANRTLAMLSKMFSFAKVKGFVEDTSYNPAQGVERFKEKKRDRWVRPAEIPNLFEAVAAEANIYAKAAIWLFLLTGARRTELLTSKWEDVDWDRKELRLPETKAGRSHHIPLSSAAIVMLESIPRLSGNPYILPGKNQGGHLVNIDKPWRRIRKAAGVDDVRIHDLRRTVGSWLATAGESLHLIGKVLNHADVQTTAIYARLSEDPARRAMEEHGQRMMDAAQGVRVIK